jgi:hypothetical protein
VAKLPELLRKYYSLRQAGSAKGVVEKALPAENLLLLDKILNKALLLSSGD